MTADHRCKPRRRGPVLENAILTAAMQELHEVGFAKMTVESVARRAGAAKVSVYQRWPSKVDLAVAATYRLVADQSPAPPTGTLRGDLFAWLRTAADQLAGPAGETFRGIVSASLNEPHGTLVLASLSRGRGAQHLRRILRDAAQRGERVTSDPPAYQLQAPQALLQTHFLTHGAPIDDTVIYSIIDQVALPLLAPGGRPPRES